MRCQRPARPFLGIGRSATLGRSRCGRPKGDHPTLGHRWTIRFPTTALLKRLLTLCVTLCVTLSVTLAGACTRSALPLKRGPHRAETSNEAAGSGPGTSEPSRRDGARPGTSCSQPRDVRGYQLNWSERCGLPERNIGVGVRGGGATTGDHACVVSPDGAVFIAFFYDGEELCDGNWHRQEGPTWRSTLTTSEARRCTEVVNVLELNTPQGDERPTELAPRRNPC